MENWVVFMGRPYRVDGPAGTCVDKCLTGRNLTQMQASLMSNSLVSRPIPSLNDGGPVV